MLDVILAYTNLHKDGYVNMAEAEKELVEMLGKKYLNIKKGYTYGVDNYKKSFLFLIYALGIDSDCYDSVTNEEIYKFKDLESRNIKDDPRNKWIARLREITLGKLFIIIANMTIITQAELFKDIEDGIIKPGIFYNLVCRATEHTKKDFPNLTKTDLLNTSYIENSNHSIKVHNEAGEIKNRISEAVLQRKNQAKQVFNNGKYRNNTAKKYKKVNGKWVENVPVTGGKRKTRRHR